MSLINYNEYQLTYKDNKFDLNEIYKILNYKILEKNKYVNKEELLTLLDIKNDNDKKFIDFLNNDFTEPIMNIFTFISVNGLNLSNNKIFNELWECLNNQQDVIITPNILKFMYNLDKKNNESNLINILKITKKHFIKFLNENKIEYEEIDFKDKRINNYKYIIEDFKTLDSKSINSKKYVLLKFKNFKKVFMIKSDILKKYINDLEKLYNDYNDYLFIKQPLLTIFEYMNKNNLILLNNDIFLNLWSSFKDKKEILITDNLLKFMGFGLKSDADGTSVHIRYRSLRHYIEFLNENNINFEQINYKDNKANNYQEIQDYIKSANPHTLHSKKWLILSIDNFKESVIMLNNKKAKEVRRYYIQLEKVFYLYSDYVKEYKLKLNEIKYKEELKKKNIELEKSKRKNLRINKFLNNITIKTKKLEWIYIASTDLYQLENIYKIGSTERLHKRITGYQTGRINTDEFYYVKVFKCYNSKDIDSFIQHILKDFVYQKHKEMYNGIHITDLIEIVEFLVNNYDKAVDYIYSFVKEKLENSMSKEPIIMEAIDLKNISISYDIEINNKFETIKIDIEEENKKLIQDTLFNFLETLEDNSKITKHDLINNLNLNINNTEIWKEVKIISKWKNSKTPIKYKHKVFFIKYRN